MSAKPAKKAVAKAASPAASSPVPASPAPAPAAVPAAPAPAWLDSPDPKKRRVGQVVLAGVWIYVAALWLLAIDQYFNLGIFGPKIPPLP